MARKILIASGKGGVGKSTAAVLIGRALAQNGTKTLLMDCDAGLSSLDIMLDMGKDSAFSWYDAYLGRCKSADAVRKAEDNLYLLAAPSMPLSGHDEAVSEVLSSLDDDFAIVLIDAPAGLNEGLLRASKAANQAIVVATADEVSVKSAAALEETLRSGGIEETRLLINRYQLKAAKKGKLLDIDTVIDSTSVRLLGIIPEDPAITYSTVTGYIPAKSKSVLAASRLAQRILGKNVELILSLLK